MISFVWAASGESFNKAIEEIRLSWCIWMEMPVERAFKDYESVLQSFAVSFDLKAQLDLIPDTFDTQRDVFHVSVIVEGSTIRAIMAKTLFDNYVGSIAATRFVAVLLFTLMARRVHEKPHGIFTIDVGDGSDACDVAFCASDENILLLPDPHFVSSVGYAELKGQIEANWVNWTAREPIIFWRGSSTGRKRSSEIAERDAFAVT